MTPSLRQRTENAAWKKQPATDQIAGSSLEQHRPFLSHATVWKFTLTDADADRFDGERMDMIEDAMFLIRQALIGNTDGPLTLPRTGIRAR